MFFIIGFITVTACILVPYAMHGGHLGILWQPLEFIIIGGAGIGSFIIGNQPKNVKTVLKSLGKLLKGSPYKKQHYMELLTMIFVTFKLMRSKGMLAIEAHIENPHESAIFKEFPTFMKNHHAEHFWCDYLRLMTMGIEDPYQMDDLMTAELDVHHQEAHTMAQSVSDLGDAFPALGIVAAVLGVIHTMGSITEPPEVLGQLIGAALVGTFFGILVAYGFVGPMGKYLNAYVADEHVYFEVMKVCILSHLKGNAPQISIEYGRKVVTSREQPSFKELEEACENAPKIE